MGFGMSKGLDLQSFRAAVKQMYVLMIDDTGMLVRVRVPIEEWSINARKFNVMMTVSAA